MTLPWGIRHVLLLASLCITVCSNATENQSATTSKQLGQLLFAPCYLPAADGHRRQPAYCTTLTVPEDRSLVYTSRTIPLQLAWLPPRYPSDQHRDPVFFLAGGPGQSALESYAHVASALEKARRYRSIILVDQRGTGGSNKLACFLSEQEMMSTATFPQAARRCLETLSAQADVRHYTTLEAIADLDAVRQAISAEQINLIGVSYGTRVAQQYARAYPQATRTLVLDSVVPNNVALSSLLAENLDKAVDRVVAACETHPECNTAFGELRSEIETLLSRLHAQPVTVSYRDPNHGQWREAVLHADGLIQLLRLYSYHSTTAALLPVLIHEAHQGRYAEIMALVQLAQTQLGDALALGQQWSVLCREDAPFFENQTPPHRNADHASEALSALCQWWPHQSLPADFHQPLQSSVPTLIVHGEHDPVTPPDYGEQLLTTLSHARHIVVPGQGHAVLSSGCLPTLVARFIENTQTQSVNTKCLDALQPTAAFTGLHGWEP